MDKIIVTGAQFLCNIGVNDVERAEKQPVAVDLELSTDISKAGKSDALSDAVDYSKVVDCVDSIVTSKPYNLIEAMATAVADEVIADFPVSSVLVRLHKPQALAAKNVFSVAVEITRSK